MDSLGTLLLITAGLTFVVFVLALSNGRLLASASEGLIALLIIGVVLAVLFVLLEHLVNSSRDLDALAILTSTSETTCMAWARA